MTLDADLAKSTKSEIFAKKYPERFYEMGIAEANMIGTGAGFALSGYVPFICSFGCFVTGRFDQIRMSVAYAGAAVRIVGTHAGIGIGDDGHSQMGLEDLALMRGLPGMQVLHPCDEIETRQMMEYLVKGEGGPAYLRLTRQNLAPVHDANYQWKLGKADILRESNSGVAILATGATVQEAMAASTQAGKNWTVVNYHTLKPFDAETTVKLAKSHRLLITVEDHFVTGGLGSAVAESLADAGLSGTKLVRLGVQDCFGESGEGPELYEKFGISAGEIVKKISSLV